MKKPSEDLLVWRGSLAVIGVVSALVCAFLPWWFVAAVFGAFLIWNLLRYTFREPDGEGPFRVRRTDQ